MPSTKITPAPLTRPLYEIAAEIRADYAAKGKPVHYAAKPYVDALTTMPVHTDLRSRFYDDPVDELVIRLLGNLGTWRGETATRVKDELKAALADQASKRVAR